MKLHFFLIIPAKAGIQYQIDIIHFFLDPGSEFGVTRKKAGMTEADLGVKSIPRNPLLFGMLYRMEAVEHIGSGIKRIRNLCREYGVDEPRIEVSEHWFTVVFPRPNVASEEAVAAGTPKPKVCFPFLLGECLAA
jgi:hypothetical protein